MKTTKGLFKVEIRKTCKICEKPLTNKRARTYCSKVCRNYFFNKKYSKMHTDWHRAKRDKEAETPSPKKVQCLVCKKWYVQVCTHVQQVHGITGRKYREAFDLEVKRGVVPKWYRELKGGQALDNGTYKNLRAGKKFRYKKGSKTAGKYRRSPITIARLKKQFKHETN